MKISHPSDFFLVSSAIRYVICVQLLAEDVVFTGYSPNEQIELHKMPLCFAVVRVFSSYQMESSEDFLRTHSLNTDEKPAQCALSKSSEQNQ